MSLAFSDINSCEYFKFLLSSMVLEMYFEKTGSSEAQWDKRWPTDLAVVSSSPA